MKNLIQQIVEESISTKKILEQIVDRVNSLKPDLIAITGDLADGSTAKLLNEVTPLKKFKS